MKKLTQQAQGKPKLIAIVGPTASGKTSLSIFLAQKIKGYACLGGEVISADSRQVYRGLNRGTGKVTKEEMAGIPHHLLDVANAKKQFSASDFLTQAKKACFGILQNNKIPIIVGGTGFYVDTLLGRMIFPDVIPNENLRQRLEKKSLEQLMLLLSTKDPKRARTVDRHNKRRIIRALEIAEALGVSPQGGPALKAAGAYEVLWVGIAPSQKQLRKNIRTRLLSRIQNGMVEEAIALHKKGLSYKRMEELGLEYRYQALLLQGKLTKEAFIEQLERAIQHYAKRQLRWFARNQDIHWVTSKDEAFKLSKSFLITTEAKIKK